MADSLNRGIALVNIVIIVAIIGLTVGVGFFYFIKKQTLTENSVPAASSIPSAVSTSVNQQDDLSEASTSIITETSSQEEVADWIVYTNNKYGFEIKHPDNYRIVMGEADSDSVKFGYGEPFFILQVLNNPKGYELEEFYKFYGLKENREIKNEEVSDVAGVVDLFKEADSKSPITVNGISTYEFCSPLYNVIPVPGKNKIVEIMIPFDVYKGINPDDLTAKQRKVLDDFQEYKEMHRRMISSFKFLY